MTIASEPDDCWYLIQEAAEILGVHPNTIRNRISAGQIPYRRVEVGGRLVYEVAITDDEATLADGRRGREKLAEKNSELSVALGREQAMRERAEAQVASLQTENRTLQCEVKNSEAVYRALDGVAENLRREKEFAQRTIERQAEKIGSLEFERDQSDILNDEVIEQNTALAEIASGAQRYYCTPGFRPWFRRLFHAYPGFARLRQHVVVRSHRGESENS